MTAGVTQMGVFGARRRGATFLRISVSVSWAAAVFGASPVNITSAEYRSTAAELASVVASAWESGVCPRSAAESVDLVRQVKDENAEEADVLARLHDLADSLLREAGYADFDETWARIATLALPDAAADRDRVLRLVACFHPGEVRAAAGNVIIDNLVTTLGAGADAADAALSILVDARVVNAFAIVTASDHVDSVPVASPADDPEPGDPPVVAALDDAILSKAPRCSFGAHDPGDKFRAGNQRITSYNNLGQRIFGVYNEMFFLYNPARYCTKFGDSNRYGETYWCLGFIACWDHIGDSYNESGHYYFEGRVQGGYKSRIRSNFALRATTWPFGSIVFQKHSVYNNMYGHFDGGISRFHGGYDPGYTVCEPACA